MSKTDCKFRDSFAYVRLKHCPRSESITWCAALHVSLLPYIIVQSSEDPLPKIIIAVPPRLGIQQGHWIQSKADPLVLFMLIVRHRACRHRRCTEAAQPAASCIPPSHSAPSAASHHLPAQQPVSLDRHPDDLSSSHGCEQHWKRYDQDAEIVLLAPRLVRSWLR